VETIPALARAVQQAVASGRIGTPVALRAHFHLSADHGTLLAALEAALTAAATWFASTPARVYAAGGARHGEITALAEYAGGQTALVSVGVLRDSLPRTDILLIGNHGTLRFQEPVALEAEAGHPGLRRAIEQSLAAGAPVEVQP
jgi:predicted dehydrogenase